MYSRGTPRNRGRHGRSQAPQGSRPAMSPLAALSRRPTMNGPFQISARVCSPTRPASRTPWKSWVQGQTRPSQKITSEAQRKVQGE